MLANSSAPNLIGDNEAISASVEDAPGNLVSPRDETYASALDFLETVQPDFSKFKVSVVTVSYPSNINSALGYSASEQLMVRLFERIRQKVCHESFIARLGDGAFICIEPEREYADRCCASDGSFISCFDHPFDLGDRQIFVSGSIGSARMAREENVIDQIRNAELALEEARRSGASVKAFAPEMRLNVEKRIEIERELREAFEYDGFFLNLQPKFSLQENAFTGFEALIRWRHPTRGIVQPSEFVQVAEETGLIIPITDWVLHEACRLVRTQVELGLDPLPIAINVPPCQVTQRDANDFIKVVKAYGIDPGLIEIELTESTAMTEAKRSNIMIETLRQAGLRVALDDFGTGYSSLARLGELSVNVLKIDRSFIRDLPDNQKSKDLVRAISAMAKALDIEIVAEGVETQRQASFLAGLGVQTAQGFLYARPMTASDAFDLVRIRRA